MEQTFTSRELQEQIPSLRRYARTLANQEADAEDLVQDCVERALVNEHRFRRGTKLRRWLFTILHNLHCDSARRHGRRGVHVPIEEWHEGASQAEHQTGKLMFRDFRRAFWKLSRQDQQVLVLVGIRGWSYERVARSLGIAVGTVKSRLFRARERLRIIQTNGAQRQAESSAESLSIAS